MVSRGCFGWLEHRDQGVYLPFEARQPFTLSPNVIIKAAEQAHHAQSERDADADDRPELWRHADPHRAAAARFALADRASGLIFAARARPPAAGSGGAGRFGPGASNVSAISPVRMRPTCTAHAVGSAGRHSPFGPLGIVPPCVILCHVVTPCYTICAICDNIGLATQDSA